jgi:ribosomal protein S18 acetylase RimI-like enzyme
MEEIRTLTGTSTDSLFTAWAEAFRDYEPTRNKPQLNKMLHRRGYVPELSFGAFDGDQLVGFTLNGLGPFEGKRTVYDTGTGTIPAYRGRGLAAKIFMSSLPFLKQYGAEQYLLEVLQHNVKAISVYSNLGFRVNREFNYFVQDGPSVQPVKKIISNTITIVETSVTEKETMKRFWDFIPSWQNSFDAISRNANDFIILGAFENKQLRGYGIIEPGTGDIPQIAVDKAFRRKGIGTGILTELLRYNKHRSIQVINTDTSCEPITAFLECNGMQKRGMQFEMVKDL